jgi:hypothetical protein
MGHFTVLFAAITQWSLKQQMSKMVITDQGATVKN